MKNSPKRLYLTSSNASKEYILDILETLSLPSGAVQHFRYQLKWLDNDLKKNLPKKEEDKEKKLRNIKVIICYLYQKERNEQWQWIAIYPIRTGILMDAYKTGDSNEDIAHFYFKVENYICDCKNIISNLSERKTSNDRGSNSDNAGPNNFIAGEGISGKNLAFWSNYLPKICDKEKSKSAFHEICKSLKFEHFSSPEGKQYYPLFCFIDGIKDKKGKFLTPKYDALTYKSFYELEEGDRCSFEFAVYFPQKPPEYSIKLLSDEKIFSTPSKYELKLDSRYYEESWNLASFLLERDIWSVISYETELKSNEEPLNIDISFPIKVKRKILYRVIDALSDIGFGVGTGSIALSKVLEKWSWWYWPVIAGYAIWAISKLVIKLWRG